MTLRNIPTSKALHESATSLYFDAWDRLITLYADFECAHNGNHKRHPEQWKSYSAAAKSELGAILGVIAQCCELKMKSILCEASPFMLLMGQQDIFRKIRPGSDFSDLRTIDAVDLPRAVATLCGVEVSERLEQTLRNIRTKRNKAMHLGSLSDDTTPEMLVDYLSLIFDQLWKGSNFLFEWVESMKRGKRSYLIRHEYPCPKAQVFFLLPFFNEMLNRNHFFQLLDRSAFDRRYLCPDCYYDTVTDVDLPDEDQVSTAFLENGGGSLFCLMCLQKFNVERLCCSSPLCDGDVMSRDHPDEGEIWCHTCGEHQSDLPEAQSKMFRNPSTGEFISSSGDQDGPGRGNDF